MKRTVIAALCACAASTAWPQEPEDAIVVTATRFPERRLDVPVGMTVITAQDIERDAARTLPELLSRLGGLQARNNSGSPDQQIDLRGFGITGDQNTLVLLDGIRLNENDLSTTKLSSIPLQSIERIEILRGSGGVLYGSGATGGTINIITRGPQHGRKELSVGAGTYGTLEARASASPASGSGIFSASHLESDNYRQNNRLRQENMTGDLRFSGAAEGVGLKFGADTQRLQLPGVRDENQLMSDPRGATTPGDWSARESGYATLTLGHRFGAADLAADVGHREQVATAYFADFAPTAFSRIKTRADTLSPRIRWPFTALGMESLLVAGLDWADWNYDRRFAGSLDTFGSPASSTSGTQNSIGGYVQYSARVASGTKVTLGGRSQRVTDHRVATGFGASDQEQTQSPRAAEAGVSQALSERWEIHGKVGTGFRVANVDENGGTATGDLLKAQTARNKELGVEYRRPGRRFGMNLYRIDLDNEIYFSPLVIAAGSVFPGANTNLSPTRREGVELFASERLSSSLDVSGNVIAQSAKFRSGVYGGVDVSGRDIPLVPRVLANLSATWHFSPATRLTGAASYVGRERYDNDQANSFERLMPAYGLLDLKLVHQLTDWTFSATINNLLDKHYYNYGIVNSFACATPVCAYPQAGLTAFASAQYAFK